ncbi:MAG TPA: hypothetical protein VGO50_05010 [Pyrinomonadaceae bacterium]|jgi:uncharacterized delta-60 repeat protein|nr:hypothetical protein [Pyrinomonadaceae bacterium]
MKNLLGCLLMICVGFNISALAQPELDTTFNSSGKALISLLEKSGAWAVAVQPDNKIILGSGCYHSGYAPFCLVRLNQDGSLDTTFGTSPPPGSPSSGPLGSVITRFNVAQQDGQATGIALQSDGKIIVIGSTARWDYNETAMARYNGDGTLDTTFGSGGMVRRHLTLSTDIEEVIRGVAIQPDGKILVTGDSMRYMPPPLLNNIWTQFVARFLPNGTLDSTFGVGGIVRTQQPGFDSTTGQSLAIQPDGKILVGGNFWSSTAGGTFTGQAYYLIRLGSDGSTDNTWNTVKIDTVITYMQPTHGISKIALQPDGRVVALGYYTGKLFRFQPNGAFDTSFDSDGVRQVFADDLNQNPYDFLISPDGRITVVGMSQLGASWITDFPYMVKRFLPDGSLDQTFGDNGFRKFYLAPGYTLDGARAAAFDSAGRIVIGGVAGIVGHQPPWENTIFSAVRLTAPAITPAPATVTGRVLTAEGIPASGVTMRMADSSGEIRTARTNPFGYYQFGAVMSGQLYSIAVKSRTVAISERSIFVAGDVSNFDFTAAPQTASKGELDFRALPVPAVKSDLSKDLR